LLVVASMGALGAFAGAGVAAAPPAPSTHADAALDWLGAQLAANGNTMPGFVAGSTDWGLTVDAVLAFVAAGRGADAAAQSATDQIEANAAAYTTWDPGTPGVREAGATAKVLLAVQSQGRDGRNVAGVDLEAELRSLQLTSGAQAGRFADRMPDPAWDASNGFGQSLAMLALALTDDGVPNEAVGFLLAQQCPAGGFRLTYGATPGCVDDSTVDTDATALAVQALLAVDRTPLVDDALDRAVQWLLARQDAATGAFGGTGPTAAINANSTGLIAQTLRAAGQTEPADAAASWITSMLQLNTANTTGTPAAPDLGAIAYQRSALDTALVSGIGAAAGDQWRRSTTQAVLALGLAPYGPVDVDPVVVPTTSTTSTTTITTPTSSTLPTDTVPIDTLPIDTLVGGDGSSGGGTSGTAGDAGGSVAGTAGTAGTGGTVGGANRAAGSRTTTGSSAATGTARLATTGTTSAPLVAGGSLLLLAGLAAFGAGAVTTHVTRRCGAARAIERVES
jgi:hypothetical protein